ncbi:alpha/beta fold hydrolase [Mycobacterium sp. pV006]|uniref:alpha/beta fold hydrolase n=1 Tax=Mycobacterium sp. pV006 TaxID=3238983 RepID=UPI00351B4554
MTRWARATATVLAVAVGWILGVVAVGVAARWVSSIPLFVFVALAVVTLTSGGSAWLAARGVSHRCGVAAITAVFSAVVFAAAGAHLVFRPLPSTPPSTVATVEPEQVRFWLLPTGSRLAYRHLPADGPARATPVLVVGGGPGEAVVGDSGKAAPFEPLTRAGFDVYLYDQLGAGLSARLNDAAGYTVARHVADLDATREQIGAEQVILVGASWGASLSASYLAEHPDRIARAILTSPAPMDYARHPEAGDITQHLPERPRRQARDMLPGNTRFLAWYGLGHVNPVAAHRLVPDSEADAFFDTFLSIVRPATVCDPASLPEAQAVGNGLYTNVFTVRDASSGAQSSVAQQLRSTDVPVLVITGECNYIPWEATADYAATLPQTTLVCIPGAGHAPELDRPRLYAELLENFVLDEPLPLPATPTNQPCHP